jgi:hypothetical protein
VYKYQIYYIDFQNQLTLLYYFSIKQ